MIFSSSVTLAIVGYIRCFMCLLIYYPIHLCIIMTLLVVSQFETATIILFISQFETDTIIFYYFVVILYYFVCNLNLRLPQLFCSYLSLRLTQFCFFIIHIFACPKVER